MDVVKVALEALDLAGNIANERQRVPDLPSQELRCVGRSTLSHLFKMRLRMDDAAGWGLAANSPSRADRLFVRRLRTLDPSRLRGTIRRGLGLSRGRSLPAGLAQDDHGGVRGRNRSSTTLPPLEQLHARDRERGGPRWVLATVRFLTAFSAVACFERPARLRWRAPSRRLLLRAAPHQLVKTGSHRGVAAARGVAPNDDHPTGQDSRR